MLAYLRRIHPVMASLDTATSSELMISFLPTEYQGKAKGWLKIADIDLTKKIKSHCPEGWNKTKVNGIEMCRSLYDTAGCYSANFSVNGTRYRKIRGMVRGYQQGSTDSFDSRRGHRSINTAYVDGVSITLGHPCKHVWTYVVGCSDDDNHPTSNYPCAAVPGPAPPSFVGENYYCESGNRGPFTYTVHYYTLMIHYLVVFMITITAVLMLGCLDSTENFLKHKLTTLRSGSALIKLTMMKQS